MLGPDDTKGCIGCCFVADNLPVYFQHLHSRDTTFAMVSRAPLELIEVFTKRMGSTMPWYSPFRSEFNYRFYTTNDGLLATNRLLNFTALGREEILPKGLKAVGWLHHESLIHDRYNGK
jgi:predicted dithiol-disulfide oxidoreductase (DUF899 family)